MADLTKKKQAFLGNTVNAVVAFLGARNQLKALVEERNADSDISGISDADCLASIYPWLTATKLANLFTVAQPDLEKILAGTAATPPAPELVEYLQIAPS